MPASPTEIQDKAQFRREMQGGRFVRQPNWFSDRITADGSSGFPAEAGRYHLYMSWACPWAHRQVLVRALKGLGEAVSMSAVNPLRDEKGWNFLDGHDDPVEGFTFLREAYERSDPEFEGRVTVPAIWDREARRIVTNDYPVIDIQLNQEFDAVAERPEVDLYPEPLRDEIDEVSDLVFSDVNNGVYKTGFATSQDAYEEAFDTLFARLEWLETRLADRRYLVGDQLTLADLRLWTTLLRFDAVYYVHFKCNGRRLVDHPNLWGFARDLYQRPSVRPTVHWDHIKDHYYRTHDRLNPTHIVAKGPLDQDWDAPHDRGRLGPDSFR